MNKKIVLIYVGVLVLLGVVYFLLIRLNIGQNPVAPVVEQEKDKNLFQIRTIKNAHACSFDNDCQNGEFCTAGLFNSDEGACVGRDY